MTPAHDFLAAGWFLITLLCLWGMAMHWRMYCRDHCSLLLVRQAEDWGKNPQSDKGAERVIRRRMFNNMNRVRLKITLAAFALLNAYTIETIMVTHVQTEHWLAVAIYGIIVAMLTRWSLQARRYD